MALLYRTDYTLPNTADNTSRDYDILRHDGRQEEGVEGMVVAEANKFDAAAKEIYFRLWALD